MKRTWSVLLTLGSERGVCLMKALLRRTIHRLNQKHVRPRRLFRSKSSIPSSIRLHVRTSDPPSDALYPPSGRNVFGTSHPGQCVGFSRRQQYGSWRLPQTGEARPPYEDPKAHRQLPNHLPQRRRTDEARPSHSDSNRGPQNSSLVAFDVEGQSLASPRIPKSVRERRF